MERSFTYASVDETKESRSLWRGVSKYVAMWLEEMSLQRLGVLLTQPKNRDSAGLIVIP